MSSSSCGRRAAAAAETDRASVAGDVSMERSGTVPQQDLTSVLLSSTWTSLSTRPVA